MTTVVKAVGSNDTAKSKSRLGSVVFRPNASIPATTYSFLVVVEIVLLVGGWLLLPSIIPNPLRILAALHELVVDQGLIGELWTSLTLNLEALALSTIISLILSYAVVIPALRLIPIGVSKGRFLSLIGLSFVMALYLGGGHRLKLGMLTFGLTVFFVTAMVDVVSQVPTDRLDYVRSMRANEWRVLWEEQVLGTVGPAFDILRQNAAMGWLMLTMVEGIVRGEGGIGKMLLDQEKHFSLAAIFAIQFVFLLVGIGQDMFIAWLKTIGAPWSTLGYMREGK